MITLKINCSKIDKAHLYQGKNGKYLDVVLFENKDGPDQYGNTYFAVQSVSKEARLAGVKGPIIGNAKIVMDQRPPASKPAPSATDESDDPVPF